ncbi:MAG: ADP-ribosylglycohydrolase family protein, partial [Acidimicrobiales bacterium]
DDTDMSVCVAQAAAKGLALDSPEGLRAVAEGFLGWYADKPPDIGNQTRAVLSATTDPDRLAEAAAAYQKANADAAGNGSLMRTGPVALAHLGDDEGLARAARAVSSLTHPHHLAGDACVLWCVAIDRAVREGRLDGIWEGLSLLPPERRGFWEETITTAETAPIESLRTMGYVVTSLQAAHRAITSTAHIEGAARLEAALRQAVGIGGDTDTVAAITGALIGARYGASAVPFPWRRHLGGWPPELGHRDLVGIGILAVSHGDDDSIGWPDADDLMPYYERSWRPQGLAVELPDHRGVIWGYIAALAGTNAQAYVSLCRIGKGQRRGVEHHEVWLMDGPDNADTGFVLRDTADAVERLRRDHGSVFVHCVRAESRTPAVAVAWLMRHRGMDFDGALAAVRSALLDCNPNPAMLEALGSVIHAHGS